MEMNLELKRALRAVDDFRQDLNETPAGKLDLSELERQIQQVIHAVGRELIREVFERADVKQPEVVIEGDHWGNRRDSKAIYTTLFGDIEVPRGIFSLPGGGPVAVPMELRLAIVEGRYTPRVARLLCRAKASMPAEEAAEMLKEAGVAMVSVSTLHRVPQAIAARYEQSRELINAQLRDAERVPDEAVTVQVGIDGVMVPQDGEHAKPRGRKAESPKAPRHEIRYGPVNTQGPANQDGIEGRSWHEGSVGTLAYWDKEGNRLRTVYLARMPESKMATLCDELELELQQALAQRPDLNVCFASDGDRHQWDVLEAIALRLPTRCTGRISFLLDFFHAAEYLSKAADLVYGADTADSYATSAEWRETLKHAEDGADRVLKSLRYHRDELPRNSQREEMQGIIDYLARNKKADRLAYAQALANHKPIGTGVTEAAAKTVVNVRMKRAGARFSQHGGQVVMLFRAAMLSGRFNQLASILEQTYTLKVRERCAA
jgi:hypothetical protein